VDDEELIETLEEKLKVVQTYDEWAEISESLDHLKGVQ
jgi:hypothetical protein